MLKHEPRPKGADLRPNKAKSQAVRHQDFAAIARLDYKRGFEGAHRAAGACGAAVVTIIGPPIFSTLAAYFSDRVAQEKNVSPTAKNTSIRPANAFTRMSPALNSFQNSQPKSAVIIGPACAITRPRTEFG